MFIESAQNICVQTCTGLALIGFSAPAPAYISAQLTLTEKETRAFAAALIEVADQLKQQAIDTARLAEINEQIGEAA